MANVKNAEKKIKQIAKTTKAHEQLKSTVKNAIKNTDKAVAAGNKAEAQAAYSFACKKLDKAVVKGIHHKNYASRQKSHLSKALNTLK